MTESSDAGPEEDVVWELLTRDFYWETPEDFGVSLYDVPAGHKERTRLQIFEVAVAAIFAKMRPDYLWFVTPNRADGGLDFVGEHKFLHDETLGISASITVGGQCKKRTRVDNVVEEVAGSLTRMINSKADPTFIVVAFSARISQHRIDTAVKELEFALRRHCHILDRHQIEGLIAGHLQVVREIVLQALDATEVETVLSYFRDKESPPASERIAVDRPPTVRAGESFQVSVGVTSTSLASTDMRLWWRSGSRTDSQISLLGPPGAESASGAFVTARTGRESPIHADIQLELLTYGVGVADLGEIAILPEASGHPPEDAYFRLGDVVAVENTRPRFFPKPFEAQLSALFDQYELAQASGLSSIAVVGAGGSGKTRVSEEFALEQRRRGAYIVTGRQAQSLDDPHRLIADLLLALARSDGTGKKPVEEVLESLAQFDSALAAQAEGAVRSVFAAGSSDGPANTEQALLSALLVLLSAKSRELPVVVHLQDLHWCTPESLSLLERLLWQLGQLQASGKQTHRGCVLVLLEGRIGESSTVGNDWSTARFESFLEAVGCDVLTCRSLTSAQSYDFTRRLFEDPISSDKMISTPLVPEQERLVEQIWRSAGGNPFHSVAQTQLLRQQGVIGKNEKNGLLYLVRPLVQDQVLPQTVSDSINARWRYLRQHSPDVALLIWGVALLEDTIPMPMFRHLWRSLAPDASLSDINSTEMIVIADLNQRQAAFSHENYVRTLRQLEVTIDQRQVITNAYDSWYANVSPLEPMDSFRWARINLECLPPRFGIAQELLATAHQAAQDRGDLRLAQRISIASLESAWLVDANAMLPIDQFLGRIDDEISMARKLRDIDVGAAAHRIRSLRERLSDRLRSTSGENEDVAVRQVIADVLHAQILFVDQQPMLSRELAEDCVSRSAAWVSKASPLLGSWNIVEMEAHHTLAIAVAASGQTAAALEISSRAAARATALSSALADHVVGSYGTLLSSTDPLGAEQVLRERLGQVSQTDSGTDAWTRIAIFLAMALIQKHVRAVEPGLTKKTAGLAEAEQLLSVVFDRSNRLGQHPDAGASALMLGILSVLNSDGEDSAWFARAVSAASRGKQLEILWRAHFNLATSLAREGRPATSVCDQALAAVELMARSLSIHADPEQSPRFEKLRVALTHAVGFLLSGEHPAGAATLRSFPSLNAAFDESGQLVLEAGWRGPPHYQRIEFESYDYFTY